jgi:hypothetical protein
VVVAVVMLITISGLLLRTPVVFKATTQMSLLCGAILWLLCGIFFLLAISLGLVCKTIVYENMNPVVPLLPAGAMIVPDILDTIDKCSEVNSKTNLFEEMSGWGDLNITVPNFKDVIEGYLQNVDYQSMINGINLAGSFEMPGSFDSVNQTVNEYNSSTIDISALKNVTFVDKLFGYLADLRNGTIYLNSSINSFTILTYGTPTQNEINTAVQYYYGQIDLILGKISNLNNTILPQLKTQVSSISVQAENTKTAAGDAVNSVKAVINVNDQVTRNALDFVDYIKGYLINTTIPKVFDNIRAFAGNATGAYEYLGSCSRFGQGVKAFEIGMCERLP